MSRILFGFALAAGCLLAQSADRTVPPATPPLPNFKLPATSESKLPNGLTVVLVEDKRFPIVTLRLAFQAGSRWDPQDAPGLAEAVAALLTDGTKTRSSKQIAEQSTELGGAIGASASVDTLTVSGSALSENVDKLLELTADVVRNASFPENEIALYKQNRKQQLLDQRSQSEFLADEKLTEVVFGSHPYARQNPTEASIDALNAKVLTGFRDRLMVPNNGVLILLGKLPEKAALLKSVQARFGDWTKRDLSAAPDGKVPEPKRSITLVDRPGSVQADVHIGQLSLTRTDPQYYALTVANAILGGGASSRLFNEIREKKGYAYSVYSHSQPFKDQAMFATVMQVRNEVVGDALGDMLKEMQRISDQPVAGQELTDVKNYISGSFVMRLETQAGLASQLAIVKSLGLPDDYLSMYTTRIRSAEPDQLQSAAKKVIAPGDAAIVVVGDAKQIKPALDKLGEVQVMPAK
jgi:zinc protease